ncbi:cupin domain-containing protein [Amycolatopsis endophytica]|uniref:Mannose-6-phosphate isomerase-like protein (Cupin superfamily) n=1 Tax=Amycolatopsis endophytica TaxID=860233 RepID=A0A853B1Z4_9PSEU|nr:cupin domain-containing protein [Amycolatopsis endophytica]NYI88845.1 mannose-6-phosphate isomerase-like protein (cupin superfamily) [Amycolatopsis endophytica]
MTEHQPSERRLAPIRRIVTGVTSEGRSTVVSDGPSAFTFAFPGIPDYGATDLWRTAVPADADDPEEPCFTPIRMGPPSGGVVFRITHFPPDELFLDGFDRSAAFSAVRGGEHVTAESDVRNPTMHRTDTVDFAIVISGEIYALLDETEVKMGPGDTLIQRGTVHGWSNRSTEDCLVAFVLVDAATSGDEVG